MQLGVPKSKNPGRAKVPSIQIKDIVSLNEEEVKRDEILTERIKCKEKDCNGYELLTEECLDTHINYHHGIQDFKE